MHIYNPDYSRVDPPDICVAHYEKGNIKYIIYKKKNYETIYQETYEEAFKIVEREKSNIKEFKD